MSTARHDLRTREPNRPAPGDQPAVTARHRGGPVTTREQRLGQARVDLAALPDLVDELARCLTERLPAEGMRGKPGSKAPLRLDVVHLIDVRRKPGWDGDDPRFGVIIDEGKDDN